MLKFLLLVAVGAAALSLPAMAQRTAEVDRRASCVYYCGSVCYWQEDIDEALNQGYSDFKSGSAPGGYPHEFEDYEGFSLPTSAPWYEFPILSSYNPYTGGAPGADRVVFDSKGKFDDLVTHTGASGNNFVACTKA